MYVKYFAASETLRTPRREYHSSWSLLPSPYLSVSLFFDRPVVRSQGADAGVKSSAISYRRQKRVYPRFPYLSRFPRRERGEEGNLQPHSYIRMIHIVVGTYEHPGEQRARLWMAAIRPSSSSTTTTTMTTSARTFLLPFFRESRRSSCAFLLVVTAAMIDSLVRVGELEIGSSSE